MGYRAITSTQKLNIHVKEAKIYPLNIYIGNYKANPEKPNDRSDVGPYYNKIPLSFEYRYSNDGSTFTTYPNNAGGWVNVIVENSSKDDYKKISIDVSTIYNATGTRHCRIYLTSNDKQYFMPLSIHQAGTPTEITKPETPPITSNIYKFFRFDMTQISVDDNTVLLFSCTSAVNNQYGFGNYAGQSILLNDTTGSGRFPTEYIATIEECTVAGKVIPSYMYINSTYRDAVISPINIKNWPLNRMHICLHWNSEGKFEPNTFNAQQISNGTGRVTASSENTLCPNVIMNYDNKNNKTFFSSYDFERNYDNKIVIFVGTFNNAQDNQGDQDINETTIQFNRGAYVMEAKNMKDIIKNGTDVLQDGTGEYPYILKWHSNFNTSLLS